MSSVPKLLESVGEFGFQKALETYTPEFRPSELDDFRPSTELDGLKKAVEGGLETQ